MRWLLFLTLTLLIGSALPLTVATAGQAPRILVLGDSISAAYRIAEDESWVARLQQRLRERDYPHEVVNASTSGITTATAKRNLDGLLDTHDPAIVILQLGGNDGLRGLSPDAMSSNLGTMADRARDSGARVLLTGIRLPSNYGEAYTERFRSAYAEVAESREIAYLPRILDGFENRRDLLLDDEIHPNSEGQRVILDNVWEALAPLLPDSETESDHTS